MAKIREVCEITHIAWLFSKSVSRRLLATRKVKLSHVLRKGFAVWVDWRDEGSETEEERDRDHYASSAVLVGVGYALAAFASLSTSVMVRY